MLNALIHAGGLVRKKGAGKRTQMVSRQIRPGRSAFVYNDYEDGDLDLENVIPAGRTSTVLFTQGKNTCALDVALFLSASFNFFKTQIDAASLAWLSKVSQTQLAARLIMLSLGTAGHGTTEPECLELNNQMRDLLFQAMADEHDRIKYRQMSDLGDVCGVLWKGLPSLSYTWTFMWICCEKQQLSSPDDPIHVRTAHPIELLRRKNDNEYRGPKIPLHKQVEVTYFKNSTPAEANCTAEGNMIIPFPSCGTPGCKQLPRKCVRIVDRLPPFLNVGVSGGCPLHHDHTYDFGHDLELHVWLDTQNKECKAIYRPVGIALCHPTQKHFTARAYSPPGFPEFQGKVCEFDGLSRGGIPVLHDGQLVSKSSHKDPRRVTELLYELQELVTSLS